MKKGDKFININGNEVEIVGKLSNGEFKAIEYRIITCRFGREVTNKIIKEEKKYSNNDLGITLFFSKDDVQKGRKLVLDNQYQSNSINIKKYCDEKEAQELKKILEEAPNGPILTPPDREALVASYHASDKQDAEEHNFRRACEGLDYFGRMDFDVEYYNSRYPELHREHYYNKFYIGRHGCKDVYPETEIIDWRSPLGSLFYDTTRRFFTPKNGTTSVYNYELLMKRKFNNGTFATLFITGHKMYKQGDVDPFLLDVLSRLRASGNEQAVDIIETIQEEQNTIIREPIKMNFYVQGCAGSGKTMILLHRLSYILYNNKNFDTSRVIIISPNESLIKQMKELSSQLEIASIRQLTLEHYYEHLIGQYSPKLLKEIKKNDVVLNDGLPQAFLDYAFTDKCLRRINRLYEECYDKIFKSLFDSTREYITVENKYNFETLQNYASKLYDEYKKQETYNKNVRLKGMKEEIIRVEQEKFNRYVSANPCLLEIEKDVLELENRLSEVSTCSQKSQNLQNLKDRLNLIAKEKEVYKNSRIIFDVNRGEKPIKQISINSLDELLKSVEEAKEEENRLLIDFKVANLEKKAFEQASEEVKTIERLKNEYEETKPYRILKRYNIERKIKIIEDDKQRKLQSYENRYKALESKLISASDNYDAILYCGRKYIDDVLLKQTNQCQNICKSIQDEEEYIRGIIKSDPINTETINLEVLKIKKEITLREEKKQILISNDVQLGEIEKQIASLQSEVKAIDETLLDMRSYSVDETSTIIKNANRLLNKNKDGFTKELKFTEYEFVYKVIDKLWDELAVEYQLSKEFLSRPALFHFLYVLERFYGEKQVSAMLNIDEAQDITFNEYEVIKNANSNCVFNLYGDKNQLINFNLGIDDWSKIKIKNLKKHELNVNYRNVMPITDYCNKELPQFKMNAMGVAGDSVKVIRINSLHDYVENSIPIIVKNKDVAKRLPLSKYNMVARKTDMLANNAVNVVTVEMMKGMEFSKVIVVDEGMNEREKYIAYTRALNGLIVVKS